MRSVVFTAMPTSSISLSNCAWVTPFDFKNSLNVASLPLFAFATESNLERSSSLSFTPRLRPSSRIRARALANGPKLILADEPTASLDSENSAQVMQIFRDLVDQESVSICMVTHDPRWFDRFDRLVEINDGRIVDDR